MMVEPRTISTSEFVWQAPTALGLRVLSPIVAEAESSAAQQHIAQRHITSPRVQKLGLALAGFKNYIHHGRIQLVGQSEIQFLQQLPVEERIAAITNLDLSRIACILVTRNLTPPPELIDLALKASTPLLQTPLASSDCIGVVSEFLHLALAPRETRHGVLLDIYGLGVLIEGRSGIGKSECALDLLTRGHRLIADDAVVIRRLAADRLQGSPAEGLGDHMEIRGLGIICASDLFGVSAVGDADMIDLLIQLERWSDVTDIDRLGLEQQTREILDVPVPYILLPVSSGRNLAVLVETAARVHLMRLRGKDAAREFVERYDGMLRRMNPV